MANVPRADKMSDSKPIERCSVTQSQTFTCPKCGAPQDYKGGSAPTIQCSYCDTTLIVPEALRTPTPNFAAFNPAEITREAGKLVEIKKLLDEGKKIQAIKVYRETFGVGLKEAKDAVEAIERGENLQVAQISIGTPQTFRVSHGGQDIHISSTPGGGVQISRSASSGCITWVIVLVVVITVLSIVLPILLSVGMFTAFAPVLDTVQTPGAIAPVVPATRAPTQTPRPSPTPTPQFANVVTEFGGKGTGAGKMSDARAIAVDNNGNVFVAEYLGGRIQIFDTDGKFKTQCLVDEKLPLLSLAADRRGNLFALQAATIIQFDAENCAVRNTLGPTGSSLYRSVAMGADGVLYAVLTGAQKDAIVRINPAGLVTTVVDSAISGQRDRPELNPTLAVDGRGNFYILGSFAGQVFKFDRSGKFQNTIGSDGSEPGQFRAVQTLAVDSQGRVYVSDVKGIQVFAPDGRYLDVFKVPEGVVSGMTFDDQDNLWVTARERVYQLQLLKR